MKFSRIVAPALLALGLGSTGSAIAGLATTAEVYMATDPGSWVGGGLGAPTVTWVHGVDGIFSGQSNYGSFLRGVQISYSGDNYWTFDFAAPSYDPVTNTNNGQPLQVGWYTNATRFPFNSPTKPGIDISGAGRGNNTETGWFDVLQISYDNAGNLAQFAVDFKQFDEGGTAGLYGSLRFNSDVPIHLTAVPEPREALLLLAGLATLAMMRRAGRIGRPG